MTNNPKAGFTLGKVPPMDDREPMRRMAINMARTITGREPTAEEPGELDASMESQCKAEDQLPPSPHPTGNQTDGKQRGG